MLSNNKIIPKLSNKTEQGYYSVQKTITNDNPLTTPNKNIYRNTYQKTPNPTNSFMNYETKYKILKVQNALLNIQLNKWKKFQAFNKIKSMKQPIQTARKKKNAQSGIEHFNMPEHLQNELMERIQERVQLHKTRQRSLLNFLIQDFQASRDRQLEFVWCLTQTLQQKINQRLNVGWKGLTSLLSETKRKFGARSLNHMHQKQKNIVQGFMMLDKKFIHMKFIAWKKIEEYKYIGYKHIDMVKVSKQEKARKLLHLNYYLQKQMKSAFHNWRLSQTQSGKQLLTSMSDHLVLYTNINKLTAFYRLLKIVRQKNYKVRVASEKIQQIFNRRKRNAFDKIKQPYLAFLACLKQLTNNIILYSNVSVNSAFYRLMKGVVSQQDRQLSLSLGISTQFKQLRNHSANKTPSKSERKSCEKLQLPKSNRSPITKSSSQLFNK